MNSGSSLLGNTNSRKRGDLTTAQVFGHLAEPEFQRIQWFYYNDNDNGVTIRLYDSAFLAKHSDDFIDNDDCILRGYDLGSEQDPLKTQMRAQFNSLTRRQLTGGDNRRATRTQEFEGEQYNKAGTVPPTPPDPPLTPDNFMPDLSQTIEGLVRQFRQVILYGPPGTGKTLHAQRVALALLGGVSSGSSATAPEPDDMDITSTVDELSNEGLDDADSGAAPTGGLTTEEVEQIEKLQQEGRLGLVVFHPAYEYEQFVIGISPGVQEQTEQAERIFNCVHCTKPNKMRVPGSNQGLSYKVEPGIFWKMCDQAAKGPVVLIIDEINRGNLPKLLGELVYALEYRDRTVRLPVEYKGSRDLKVPKSLYIIGTMNSSDRSIGHIDVAVRRRFGLFHVEPQPAVVKNFWQSRDPALGGQLVTLMERLNKALDDKDPGGELRVGHAYFLADPDLDDNTELRRQVARKWEHQVSQLLQEYGQLMNLGTGFFAQFPADFNKALQ